MRCQCKSTARRHRLSLLFLCLLPPFCLPLSAFQGEAIRGKSLRARVLSMLKPKCFSSPSKLATKLSSFSSPLFFHFLLHQMPQISMTAASDLIFCIALYISKCVLPVVVILFTSWRGVRRGEDLLWVLQGALCAAGKLFTHPLHHPGISDFPPRAPAENPGRAHPGVTPREDFCPALPWLSATALSQSPATSRFISCPSVPFPGAG